MRNTRIVAAVATAVLALGLGSAAGPAAAVAPEDVGVDISVSIVTPQPALPTDPGGLTVKVVARVDSCLNGCRLARYGSDGDFWEYLASHPPAQGPVSIEHTERFEPDILEFWDRYDVRDASNDALLGETTHPLGAVLGQEALRYDISWSVDSDLGSTGHLVRRTSTRSATATFRVPDTLPAGVEGQIGIVSARGPNNGVMSIRTNRSATPITVDLRAARWTPRQVVAVMAVVPSDVITVTNVTPAGRSSADVHVDGVAINWESGPGQPVGPALDRTRPGIELQLVPGQQLPVGATSAQVAVRSRTFGCPEGCSLVEGRGTPPRLLDRWTSPASTTVTTRTYRTSLLTSTLSGPYRVQGSGQELETPDVYLQYVPELQLEFSHGWTVDDNGGSLDGSIARTATRGAGVTYRPPTAVFGQTVGVVAAKGPRNGVMAVYANGKIVSTVDLYAPTWQPRRVVASTYVPADARITVQNRTPAGRANADVHVDGLLVLADPTCYTC